MKQTGRTKLSPAMAISIVVVFDRGAFFGRYLQPILAENTGANAVIAKSFRFGGEAATPRVSVSLTNSGIKLAKSRQQSGLSQFDARSVLDSPHLLFRAGAHGVPHALEALANAGHDTRAIQDWLGHRSLHWWLATSAAIRTA